MRNNRNNISEQCSMVVDYILWFFQDHGDLITNLKLQKLLYYAQGWYLALYDTPLFNDQIEAWVHGPVVPSVYHANKIFRYAPITREALRPSFSENISEHLDEVIEVYGSFSALELEHLTHLSDPWKKARGNIPIDQPSNNVIVVDDMKEYFKKKMAEGNEQKNQR